jgi:hypothetical protein
MTADRSRSADAVLRAALTGGDPRRVLLDPAFQGLPDTAHGGTVLALFDAVAAATAPRVVSGVYRRRVPLDSPLSLVVEPGGDATAFRLLDGDALLVEGTVEARDGGTDAATTPGAAALAALDGLAPLPISRTCFACGIDNPLGLRARLRIDDELVGGVWEPDRSLRSAGGEGLAPVAVTTLLDEAAFWLGAAASGESGMTTELRVRIHAPLPFGAVLVGGARGTVRARAHDRRNWDTAVVDFDAVGTLLASADITFVAVRGAARKLVAGLLAVNPPDVMRRVFPGYVT